MPTLPTKISTSLGADDGAGSSYTDVGALHTSAIENMPGDFVSMDTATHNLNYSFSGSGDDTWTIEIGIRDSLDQTLLAGQSSGSPAYVSLYNGTADGADHYSGPTAFPYVNTSATKAQWDRATLYVSIGNSRNMGGDGISLILDRFELGGTYSTSGITVTVGQASETDTSQAVAHTHSARAVGQSSETDSAQVVTPTSGPIVVNVGQASTTASAQPVSHAHSARAVGQASTTATSQPVAHVHSARLVGQASTTDTAQPVSGLSTVAVGQAVETDTAQAVTPSQPQSVNVGQSYEDNFGLAVTIPPTRLVNLATETDSAQVVTPSTGSGPTIVPVGQAATTDTATTLTWTKVMPVGQAATTATAQPVSIGVTRLVKQVREFDYAGPIIAPRESSKIFVGSKDLDLPDLADIQFDTDATQEFNHWSGPTVAHAVDLGLSPQVGPMTWLSSTNYLVINQITDTMYEINKNTMSVVNSWPTPGVDNWTHGGVALDPATGHLWAVNRGNDTIYELDTDYTTVLNTYIAPGGGLNRPRGLAFFDDGSRLFLGDDGLDTIYELNKSTGAVINQFTFDVGWGAIDMTMDEFDNLWVMNGDTYSKVDPDTGVVLETYVASWDTYGAFLSGEHYVLSVTDNHLYELSFPTPYLKSNTDEIRKLTVTANLKLTQDRDPGDDIYTFTVRIMRGSTVLAAADAGGTAVPVAVDMDYHAQRHTFGPIRFDYVNNTAPITNWADAKMLVGQEHTQVGDPDLVAILMDYVELEFIYTLTPVVVAVGQVSETDTAQPIGAYQPGIAQQATETDTAQPLTIAKTVSVGQALEASTAQTVTVRRTIALGQAVESATSQPLTWSKVFPLGLVTEVDTALQIFGATTAPDIELVRLGPPAVSTHVHSPRTDVDMDPGPHVDTHADPPELTSLWGTLEAR